jgi:hypothetical protein
MTANEMAVETLRRLAASWERLGHHEAAKDALARADRLAKKVAA